MDGWVQNGEINAIVNICLVFYCMYVVHNIYSIVAFLDYRSSFKTVHLGRFIYSFILYPPFPTTNSVWRSLYEDSLVSL